MDPNLSQLSGEKVQAQLVITLTTDGLIHVNGPVGNKLLCFGMLKFAEQIIGQAKPQNGSPILTPPRLNLG